MATRMVMVKSSSEIELIHDAQKPCYLLNCDPKNPQLVFLSIGFPPQHIPFDQDTFDALQNTTETRKNFDKFINGTEQVENKSLPLKMQKAITDLTGHKPLSIDQGKIIGVVNTYFKAKNYSIAANKDGICAGLAAVHCKYVSEGKEDEFFQYLQILSKPEDFHTKQSDAKINNFLGEILHAYNPGNFVHNTGQKDSIAVLKVANPQSSNEKQNLRTAFKLNASTTDAQWEKILEKTKFEGAIYSIGIPGHALSMHYKNNRFYIYDPNNPEGLKSFASAKEAIKNLKETIIDLAIYKAEQNGVDYLDTKEGRIKIKFQDGKFHIYDNPQNPQQSSIVDSIKNVKDSLKKSTENIFLPIGLSVIENPYHPINDVAFPSPEECANILFDSIGGVDIKETIFRGISRDDATLADQLEDYLVDPKYMLLATALSFSSHIWLKKLLDRFPETLTEAQIELLFGGDTPKLTIQNDTAWNTLLNHPSIKNSHLSTDIKEKLLEHAINSNNPASITLVMNLLKPDELSKLITEEKIYYVVHDNKTGVLAALLDKKEITEDIARYCMLLAVNTNKLDTIHYLLEKFPEYNLAQSVNITADIVKRTNVPILMSLKEKGANFAEGNEGGINYSAEQARTLLALYDYAYKPTPEKLTQLLANKDPATIDIIPGLLSEMITNKKISPDKITPLISATNPLLSTRLIETLATKLPLDSSLNAAIQDFAESMIEEKNNTVLKTLLDLKPLLPLDYQKLYEKAFIIQENYNKSWWPAAAFASKPDATILAELKNHADLQTATMLCSHKNILSAIQNAPAQDYQNSEKNDHDNTDIPEPPEQPPSARTSKSVTYKDELKKEKENTLDTNEEATELVTKSFR